MDNFEKKKKIMSFQSNLYCFEMKIDFNRHKKSSRISNLMEFFFEIKTERDFFGYAAY